MANKKEEAEGRALILKLAAALRVEPDWLENGLRQIAEDGKWRLMKAAREDVPE